jgi:RNA polymerase sigma factor (sigma-70 family)
VKRLSSGSSDPAALRLLPDSELIANCLGDDAAAWEALVERYAPLVNTVTLRMGLSTADGADVFQEVCLLLLRHLEDLREPSRLAAWIISTTRREVWRLRRRRGPHLLSELGEHDRQAVEALESEPDATLDEQLIALEQAFRVRQALEQLPDRCRDLLAALYLEDPPCSYAELGPRLGLAPGSVGPIRTRCLAQLRRILEKTGFQP